MPVPRHIFEQLKAIIPPLNGTLYKGQSGQFHPPDGRLSAYGISRKGRRARRRTRVCPVLDNMLAVSYAKALKAILARPTLLRYPPFGWYASQSTCVAQTLNAFLGSRSFPCNLLADSRWAYQNIFPRPDRPSHPPSRRVSLIYLVRFPALLITDILDPLRQSNPN
jgi:hypothetical protein